MSVFATSLVSLVPCSGSMIAYDGCRLMSQAILCWSVFFPPLQLRQESKPCLLINDSFICF